MHSWKKMVDLLERVNRPKSLGFQADMAHTLLYILGYNATEDAILPPEWDWSDPHRLDEAMKTLTQALRPWTMDFHVAQNDATVHGSGTHDKTGHHCLPNDPNGKLSISHHAGYWLHGEDGRLTKAFRHICWDGCMFPNEVMMKPETWNSILGAMIAVRDAHGWREEQAPAAPTTPLPLEVEAGKPAKPAAGKAAKRAPGRNLLKPAKKPPKRPVRRAVLKKAARINRKRKSPKRQPTRTPRSKSKPKKGVRKKK